MGTIGRGAGDGTSVRSPHLPRTPRGALFRPRLAAALDAGAALTLVHGPLGFGKTTLVAQWLREGGFASGVVAWLRVRPDGASALWEDVLHQLRIVGVPPVETQPAAPTREVVRRSLAAAGRPVLLVLDQFERVGEPAVEHAVLELLRDCPALRVVVCTRTLQTFRTERLTDLDVMRVGPRQLTFTAGETAKLLASAGTATDAERAAIIHEETGGWPEPTRGIVLALAEEPDAPSDVSVATRITGEFFQQRLFPDVADPATRESALLTSVPDELPLELAIRLTGSAEAPDWLADLERHGVLSVESHDGPPVYHWAPAARRVLLAELLRRDPEAAAAAYRTAADWYRESGEVGTALRYSLLAQAPGQTVDIVDEHWLTLVLDHRDELLTAVTTLPRSAWSGRFTVLGIRDLLLRQPDDDVLDVLPAVPSELASGSEVTLELVSTGLLALQVLERRGQFGRLREFVSGWQDVIAVPPRHPAPGVSDRLPGLALSAGLAALVADDLDGARRNFEQAHDYAVDRPGHYVERDAAGKLALVAGVCGEARLARNWLDRFHGGAAVIPAGWLRRSAEHTARLAGALAATEELELGEAGDLLAVADELGGPSALWGFEAYAAARYGLHTGAAVAGLQRLDDVRARNVNRAGPGSTAHPLLTSVEIDLLLAAERGNEAAEVLARDQSQHPLLRVARARFALLTGDFAEVLRLGKDVTWARRVGRGHHVDMLVLRAVAHHRLGQPRAAAESLQAALATARLTGSLRPFAAVPRADLVAVADHLPGAGLLDTAALRRAPEIFPTSVPLVRLTARERVFLDCLAQGMSGAQIAHSLYISFNTAKSHLRRLYRKLDTSSREQALARAVELGLLSRDRIAGAGQAQPTEPSPTDQPSAPALIG